MDSITMQYEPIIKQVFNDYINFIGQTNEIQLEAITDSEHQRYLLVEIGWQNGRRIYGTLLHIDIIDNKLWIQHDGTENGIANELVALGIAKQHIVLAFKPIERRKITEFAIH